VSNIECHYSNCCYVVKYEDAKWRYSAILYHKFVEFCLEMVLYIILRWRKNSC